jgi:hypothetical protein
VWTKNSLHLPALFFGVTITVQLQKMGDRSVCRYEAANHTGQPIVAFAIGGNEQLAGPYEIPVIPAGFHPDTGAGEAAYAPDGWEVSLLREPAGDTYAVEWQTKDGSKALLPEATERFDLAFETAAPNCRQGHWTAITRDSQIHSGSLNVKDQ